mmetsp:Transcript_10332/g.22799  ORF Transcript_10332/g.22799 Transcript_10332/m.22799 type:complete len:278 (+) Transcript_10332:80-913(+)
MAKSLEKQLEELNRAAAAAPLPDDDDDDDILMGGEPSGYGPMRTRDDKQHANADGIVFKPAEVQDAMIEIVEEEDDAEASSKPDFKPLTIKQQTGGRKQFRRVQVPPHRMTPLKTEWMALIQPVVEHLKLQVRMNTKRRAVEIRNSNETEDVGYLQKAADYFRAFMLGFDQADAIALLRLDDLFIETFEVKDVKRLQGDHLSRCIGRIAGKDGKTKYAIENATRTRISLCEDKIHILGSFANIRLARDSVCNLILGSTPGKVYTKLRTVSKRLQERI